MRVTLTLSRRGAVTLPPKLRAAMGLGPNDLLLAETTPEGMLLRPATAQPLELYGAKRIAEFDAAEAEAAAALAGRAPAPEQTANPRSKAPASER